VLVRRGGTGLCRLPVGFMLALSIGWSAKGGTPLCVALDRPSCGFQEALSCWRGCRGSTDNVPPTTYRMVWSQQDKHDCYYMVTGYTNSIFKIRKIAGKTDRQLLLDAGEKMPRIGAKSELNCPTGRVSRRVWGGIEAETS